MTFRALCDKAKGIRLPVHVHGKLSEVLRARDELQQELGKEPTVEEIAERMEMTEEIARAFSVEQAPYIFPRRRRLIIFFDDVNQQFALHCLFRLKIFTKGV